MEPETTTTWSAPERLAFRFAFCYFGLYLFPSPQGAVPGTGLLAEGWEGCWARVVPWAAAHLLGISGPVKEPDSGSGDTTFRWVQAAVVLVASLLATLVWSLLDRRRMEYRRLDRAFRVYVRYGLGFTMLAYGVVKVVPYGQFPPPNTARLLQPFGDATPMGLLWTFMGASPGYAGLCGLVEMVAGTLLLFRRTALLGALLSAGAMANVAALNFCYDVPVKLFSSHLLLLSLFLLLPDAGRLARLFLWNQPVAPEVEPAPIASPWGRRLAAAAPWLLLAAWVALTGKEAREAAAFRGDPASYRLTGLWTVEEATWQEPPPGTEGAWRRVAIPGRQALAIQLHDDTMRRFFTTYDAARSTLKLTPRDAPEEKSTLTVRQPDADHLVLEGPVRGRSVVARLRRSPEPPYRLLSRPFRWVTEYPDNY